MTTPPPRIPITVVEQPETENIKATFRASAQLPNGTTVDVIRESREEAIRTCANQCHILAGVPIVTVIPHCKPDWSLPYWDLPRFRHFDPDYRDPSDDPTPLPTSERQGQDGATPLPVDFELEDQ